MHTRLPAAADDTVAWLIPEPDNKLAAETIRLNPHLAAPYPPSALHGLPPSQSTSATSPLALRICFSTFPAPLAQLTIGTSPASVIVLPPIPRLSPTHALLVLNPGAPLVLRDAHSACGSAVFFDGESSGPRAGGCEWVLGRGCGGASEVVLDMQGVRFRVELPSGAAAVTAAATGGAAGTAEARATPRTAAAQAISVSRGATSETYLWNLAQPWEPVVQITG